MSFILLAYCSLLHQLQSPVTHSRDVPSEVHSARRGSQALQRNPLGDLLVLLPAQDCKMKIEKGRIVKHLSAYNTWLKGCIQLEVPQVVQAWFFFKCIYQYINLCSYSGSLAPYLYFFFWISQICNTVLCYKWKIIHERCILAGFFYRVTVQGVKLPYAQSCYCIVRATALWGILMRSRSFTISATWGFVVLEYQGLNPEHSACECLCQGTIAPFSFLE